MMPWLIAALLALSGAGCRSIHTSLENWQPAPAHVQVVRSLVIPQFQGDRDNRAREIVLQKVAESQFYQLAPANILDQQLADASQNALATFRRADLVLAARRMGVDAILLGEVKSELDLGTEMGGIMVRIGDPKVITRIHFELVDTRNGQILVTHDEIYAQQAAECAVDVATKLCPYSLNVSVPLEGDLYGGGSELVRQGVDLAQQEQWNEAAERWRQAIQENADNQAAHYNLGVAYERHCDFAGARSCYEAAARINNKQLYQQALERVQKAEQGLHLVQQQRARMLTPRSPIVAHRF
jgi:tetratricopeptide (TPR) repeat protein